MDEPRRRRVEVETTWRVTRLLVRLALVAVLGLAAAVLSGRPVLVVFAAPALAAAAIAVHQRKPAESSVTSWLDEERCFEGDTVDLHVEVEASSMGTRGEIDVELELPVGLELEGQPRRTGLATDRLEAIWTIRAQRWGRWPIGPLRVRLRSRGLAYVEANALELGTLTVFPPAPRPQELAVPPVLLARIGAHVSRRVGAGSEFAEVGTYIPGDEIRRINWPVSTRRGELYVNRYLAERAADVVAVVDATVDIGPWGNSSLDRAVRGCAAVVQAYLRYADRAGVVALGGRVRWLSPELGSRQYYRIVETLLAARRDYLQVRPEEVEVQRLPRQALPPGALAFVLSPLVDNRALEAIRELRERGHPVVVVDVLGQEPPRRRGPDADLALRIWRLDREVVLYGLEQIGAVVLPWDDETGAPLERARLDPLLRGVR